MQVGLMIPQGWKYEYRGWEPAAAWQRTLELTRDAERLGFESLWVFDHFHTVPDPTDDMTFESFTMLAAMAMATERVRLGHMVVCTAFRNPGVTAKMASTIDLISNGRFELGIGAGWKRDEWLAYGYGFPTPKVRLEQLDDHLAVITQMLDTGRATFEGTHAYAKDAINQPHGIQPHIPIIVGGNGREMTARIAAKYADELNLVYEGPDEVRDLIRNAREKCEEAGRDPDTLRMSLYVADDDIECTGQERIDVLGTYAELPLTRIVLFPGRWDVTLEGQARFAEECVAAGLELGA